MVSIGQPLQSKLHPYGLSLYLCRSLPLSHCALVEPKEVIANVLRPRVLKALTVLREGTLEGSREWRMENGEWRWWAYLKVKVRDE